MLCHCASLVTGIQVWGVRCVIFSDYHHFLAKIQISLPIKLIISLSLWLFSVISLDWDGWHFLGSSQPGLTLLMFALSRLESLIIEMHYLSIFPPARPLFTLNKHMHIPRRGRQCGGHFFLVFTPTLNTSTVRPHNWEMVQSFQQCLGEMNTLPDYFHR